MKRVTGVLIVFVMMVGFVGPAHAGHGAPVDGLWLSRDVYDGSIQSVTITEVDPDLGLFTVILRDTWSRAPGGAVTVKATAALYHDGDKILYADFTRWKTRGEWSDLEPYHLEFEVSVDDGVMVDSDGNVWTHVSG